MGKQRHLEGNYVGISEAKNTYLTNSKASFMTRLLNTLNVCV